MISADNRFKGLLDKLDSSRNSGARRPKPSTSNAFDPRQGFEEDTSDEAEASNRHVKISRGGRCGRGGRGGRTSKWFKPAASSVHSMDTRKKLY